MYPPGQAVAELRDSILPSPAPGVQSHKGPLTTEDTLPPELCWAPPPRALFQSLSQALWGRRAPHSQEHPGIYSHRQGPTGQAQCLGGGA